MRKLRHKLLAQRLVGLLSVLLLLQGLFPLQMHTQLTRNGNGKLVEVCTIDGLEKRLVDDQGDMHDVPEQDSERTAAVAFSQILTEALPDIPVIVFTPYTHHFHDISDARESLISVLPAASRPIRAPPV